jgi:hypothetical protein
MIHVGVRSHPWLDMATLHPTELETLRVYMYVHDGQVNEEMDSHITENWRAFRRSVLF